MYRTRTAISAGLIGLTAVALAVDPEPDKNPQRTAQVRARETATTLPEPGKIRLELPINLLEQAWTMDQLRRSDPGRLGVDEKRFSEVRLLDGDYLVANWRNGRVQYVVKGVNPWGASVGGQLGTSTAKVTLSWSFND
jgi:hypothetical protein